MSLSCFRGITASILHTAESLTQQHSWLLPMWVHWPFQLHFQPLSQWPLCRDHITVPIHWTFCAPSPPEPFLMWFPLPRMPSSLSQLMNLFSVLLESALFSMWASTQRSSVKNFHGTEVPPVRFLIFSLTLWPLLGPPGGHHIFSWISHILFGLRTTQCSSIDARSW